MNKVLGVKLFKKWCMAIMVLLIGVFLHARADAINLKVVYPVVVTNTGGTQTVVYQPITGGFRWLLEEDNTVDIKPGVPVVNPLALQVHNSTATVAKAGHSNTATAIVTRPKQLRYQVSVLPDAGYAMGGALLPVGKDTVTVIVNPLPLPTAQVSVFVFNDNNPINNAPDLTEPGLTGFNVLIFDQLGQMSLDAFGNPLGTEYQRVNPADPKSDFVFDADGNPVVSVLGSGVFTTDATGNVIIKNINPGKYGIRAIAPIGSPWVQTNTIEGTPGIDTWVNANEPKLLVEFGPAFNHVFIGFVNTSADPLNPDALPWVITPPTPGPANGTVTGRIIYNHTSPPPGAVANPGLPVPNCYVGLNDTLLAAGAGLITAACDANSNFTIPNVPPGTYQLVIWDKALDSIFNFTSFTVPETGGTIDLGPIITQAWFGTLQGSIFQDLNENGFRDLPEETGIPDMVVNLRFRDGSIYQSTTSNPNGDFSRSEIIPFFRWLVAEVDYSRFKATGATIIADTGGSLTAAPATVTYPGTGTTYGSMGIVPQIQPDGLPYRIEQGVTLLEGLMTFADQTNRIDFGKNAYGPGQKGDLTGVIYYATTRAENDARQAAVETWEPGIARVQVNLYTDFDNDGVIDDRNGNGIIDLADVNNYPFGNFPGPEDKDRNGNGVFDFGDGVSVATSDAWDDHKPTGCIQNLPIVHGQQAQPCFDGFFTWNQVRPEVFDGGYAFNTFYPAGPKGPAIFPLPNGQYIIEAVPPPGYEIQKEEDKNVDFGNSLTPSKQLLPPLCVGAPHTVPPFLTLFPDQQVPAFFAGQVRPLCDRKEVTVTDGINAAADFFMFTLVPKSARAVGQITNDLAAGFAPNDPGFGEKATPAWLPISFKDFAGNEIARTYSDEFGAYNALLPGTYTINPPIPTGVSPNMVNVCLNNPGPIPDPNNPGKRIMDPFFNPSFTQNCYTLDFWPGKTTYLDTPLLPVSAFANGTGVVDINPPAGTPVIASVTGPQGGAITCANNEVIIIRSMGTQKVPNPAYDRSILNSAPIISRDFGFGNVKGTITINGAPLAAADIISWNAGVIKARIPLTLAPGGELLVTRGDNGLTTDIGVNLHIFDGCVAGVVRVNPVAGQGDYTSIQAAIDDIVNVPNGALILVAPGTYNENLIIHRNVRLQGSGAGQTIINANPGFPTPRVQPWVDKVTALINANPGVLLVGPTAATTQTLLTFTQIDSTPGILVLVSDTIFSPASPGLIDGFTIRGATNGGGVLVNGYAHNMEISNNKITGNVGNQAGGVRIGFEGANGHNDNVKVHHNEIVSNGSFNGAGGIAFFDGATGYQLTDNVVSGNVAAGNGGGLLHEGLNNNALIARNKIAFNEVFSDQSIRGSGGGIFITSGTDLAGAGNVTIDRNLIQGNLAGAGQGGGIRALTVNQQDIVNSPADPTQWYALKILNNMIVNNVATDAGGAIALNQAARVYIANNTISHNDSVATALVTFAAGNLTESIPQPAGIVSTANNQAYSELTGQLFSDPLLTDNIIWQNRSFFWRNPAANGLPGLLPASQHSSGTFANADYWDLEVITSPDALVQVPAELNALKLNPDHCILTSLTGPLGDNFTTGIGNLATDPRFVKSYVNELATGQAADEAGNFINVFFRPLTLSAGDYHIIDTSPAVAAGVAGPAFPELAFDFDSDPRPTTGPVDIGADQIVTISNLVSLVRPNGGEVFPAGSTFEIDWTAPVEATQFDLFFSSDNGATWIKINNNITEPALNANGKLPGRHAVWTVPTPQANKKKCLIRVIGFTAAGVRVGSDQSIQPFTTEVVHLDSPNGGTYWTSGTTQTVFWTANDTRNSATKPVTKVRILITTNGGATWTKLVPDQTGTLASPGAHSINVTVPTVNKIRNKCLIKVVLLNTAGQVVGSDISDGFFGILPAPAP